MVRVIKPFIGEVNEEINDWITSFERVATINRWNDQAKCVILPGYLTKTAESWYKSVSTIIKGEWILLRNELVQTFQKIQHHQDAYQMVEDRIQEKKETIEKYAQEFVALINQADPSMEETTKVRMFARGLKDESIRAAVMRKDPKTISEALEVAMKEEKGRRAARLGKRKSKPSLSSSESSSSSFDEEEIPKKKN